MVTTPAGIPIWCDLSTADVSRARAYYSAVLGWTFAAAPDADGWVLASAGDTGVAVVGPVMGDYPPTWTLYLSSTDTDTDVARASELGGVLFAGPMDIEMNGEHLGRMAVLGDPAGAAFGLWQSGSHAGFTPTQTPGHPSWFELSAGDVDLARAFYTQLYGWRSQQIGDGVEFDYTTMSIGDREIAGIMRTPAAYSDNSIPAMWVVYFSVSDTDAAVAAGEAAGGRTVLPSSDSPYGRIALLADPDGALFKIVGPNHDE